LDDASPVTVLDSLEARISRWEAAVAETSVMNLISEDHAVNRKVYNNLDLHWLGMPVGSLTRVLSGSGMLAPDLVKAACGFYWLGPETRADALARLEALIKRYYEC
jgi:hypothetical protein